MRFLIQILTISISIFAICGDYIVFKSKYSDSFIFRALFDSCVHGILGFLSSAIFFSHKLNISNHSCVLNMIFCTFMSSFIDIDHFVVAKSIYLKDLTNLKQRGFMHCTSLWLLLTVILLTYSHLTKKVHIYLSTFMLILSYTSHHIRDGNRRGLWVYPFGHTSPIPSYMYVSLLAVLPNILAYTFLYSKPHSKDNVEYSMVI